MIINIYEKMNTNGGNRKDMGTDTGNRTLGDYVRGRRESRGLNYYKAANESGLDHTYWRKLEDGQYSAPSPKALAAIATTVHAPIGDLYALVGYPAPKGLPSFTPYLRGKYHLPPEAIRQLEGYFAFLRAQYDIPDDEPVFPPKNNTADSQDGRAS